MELIMSRKYKKSTTQHQNTLRWYLKLFQCVSFREGHICRHIFFFTSSLNIFWHQTFPMRERLTVANNTVEYYTVASTDTFE